MNIGKDIKDDRLQPFDGFLLRAGFVPEVPHLLDVCQDRRCKLLGQRSEVWEENFPSKSPLL